MNSTMRPLSRLSLVLLGMLTVAACSGLTIGPVPDFTCPPRCHPGQ
ncbi:MAG TPA: hypothetical protein VFA50_19610 [Stellaceae bacterium]|nr:hypothetical protein [Stellaceae bacterium]